MIVTKKALDFTAPAVLGNNEIVQDFNLYKNIGPKGAVVFFYPKDFTFVCPSEIIAFDKRYQEFKNRGIEVIGISGDNEFSHFAWKNTPVNQGGIGQVKFPLVADLTKQIAKILMYFMQKQLPFVVRSCLMLMEQFAMLWLMICH